MTIWNREPKLKNRIIRQAVWIYSFPMRTASADAFAAPATPNTPFVPKIQMARKMKSTMNVKVSVSEKIR